MGDLDSLSNELKQGLLVLDQVSGYRELSAPQWCATEQAWWWRFNLGVDIAPNPWLSSELQWVLKVSHEYPWGDLSILPDAYQGLTVTFPHQLQNSESEPRRPWRLGKLCVADFVQRLGRAGRSLEPWTVDGRLRWNVERMGEWLYRASRDDLLAKGDPFELPQLSPVSTATIAFDERLETLAHWSSVSSSFGRVKLMSLPEVPDQYLVRDFETIQRKPILSFLWGSWVRERWVEGPAGAWMRFEKPIIDPPWQVPEAWSDLRSWCKRQGRDLHRELTKVGNMLRKPYEHVPWVLMLGFPIQRRIGDLEAARMHWLALKPPELIPREQFVSGFRARSSRGLAMQEKKLRAGNLPWVGTSSWSEEDLGSRGRLPPRLEDAKVLLVGAGAVGSQIAELLVRGGVRQIVVVDHEQLEMGNLVRHTLTMQDLGKPKVEGLTSRLAALSPHVEVRGIEDSFPTSQLSSEELSEFDLVIETTGDNFLLAKLDRAAFSTRTVFCSLSIGLSARRLYAWLGHLGAFNPDDFHRRVNPWLERDRIDMDPQEMPWEGVGCWHPVFPARLDDIALLTSLAVKELAWRFERGEFSKDLSIWEQQLDDQGWLSGVRSRTEQDLVRP